MEKNYLVGIGEILWDITPDGKTLGGAPANFAYHAGAISRLIGADLQGLVVSAIGNDPLADETLAELKPIQLETHLSVVEHDTGRVNVCFDEKGEPQYEIVEDVAWDHIPYNGLAHIASHTRAVCFGTLAQRSPKSRETIRRFLQAVPADCMKIYDINLRNPFYNTRIIKKSLELCNTLKINQDEAIYLSRLLRIGKLTEIKIPGANTELKEFVAQLIQHYTLKMVVVTCGRDGSFVFTQDGKVSFRRTPKVEQVSAVGAGDSFTGTLCACLAAGWSVRKAHKTAVEVSAYVVTQPGAMPDMAEAPISVKSVKSIKSVKYSN